MNGKTDQEITGDVIAAFAASPNVHATDMIVSTQHGLVRLMGAAGTLEECDEAERIASRIVGVTHVENDLVISANREITDLEMADAVNAELAAYPDLMPVGAKVLAGTATLMGKVPSLAVENRAIEVASGVAGIRMVISDLNVTAGEPVDDITLANDVAETISDDPEINILDMEVHAEDGLVVVSGEVESEREFNLITERASAVRAVRHVENLARVRPGAVSTPLRPPSSSGTEYQKRPLGTQQQNPT